MAYPLTMANHEISYLTNDTCYTPSALQFKRALLKNVITLAKSRKYQIVGTTTITYNNGTIQPTLSRMEIYNNYNRGNKAIAMSQPKILTVYETKISWATIKKTLKPQLYKRIIIQQSNRHRGKITEEKGRVIEAHWWRSSVKTGFGFFRYFTFLFLNISILGKYIMKNCFLFLHSLNLYILGLRATQILIRSMPCFSLFNFLINHFALVSQPKINLNFYKYNAVTRIDSSSNFIRFYSYYSGNCDTIRRDFDQKSCFVLHAKI